MKSLIQIVVVFVIVVWAAHSCMAAGDEGRAQRAAVEAAKTPEQKAKEAADHLRFEFAVTGAKSLKAASREPDSFHLDNAWVYDNGTVCYTYRGRNGFGGVSVERAIAAPGAKGLLPSNVPGFAGEWNKRCAAATQDMASAIRVVL